MRKATVLLAILLPCLLTSVVEEFCTVKAQSMSIDLEFVSSPPAYVNQPFEIMATVSGGTPPYTYQWYTKWFPPWKPGMDPAQYVASSGSEIAVPGATSATFWFTPTIEGLYWISVGISDSAGQSVSRYPSIQPFQLIVHNPQPLVFERLFDVDLLYAYVQPGASSAVAVLNFTRVSNITLPSDEGITEVYTLEVFSEGKIVRAEGAIGCIIGNGISNGSILMDLAMGFGHFEANTPVGLKALSVDYSPILNPVLVEPISLSVVRLGWITVDGNSTDINFSSHETVKHVELAQYQEGFLYNTLLPQEKLSQIDLFSPLKSYNATSPTITPIFTPPPIITPTTTISNATGISILTIAVIVTVVVLVAVIVSRHKWTLF